MDRRLISTLKYETRVTPGSYFHLKTNWFSIDEEIETIIIDQSRVYSKILSIYPKGFFMYLEQDDKGCLYRTNFPLYMPENEDSYHVDFDLATVEKPTPK